MISGTKGESSNSTFFFLILVTLGQIGHFRIDKRNARRTMEIGSERPNEGDQRLNFFVSFSVKAMAPQHDGQQQP